MAENSQSPQRFVVHQEPDTTMIRRGDGLVETPVSLLLPINTGAQDLRERLESSDLPQEEINAAVGNVARRGVEQHQNLVNVHKEDTRAIWEGHIRERTDSKTGLGNGVAFNEALAEIAEEEFAYGEVVIMALDLDGFKSLNERLGHNVADDALGEVGKQLSSKYTAYRDGGDEFQVILRREAVEAVLPDLIDNEGQIVSGLVDQANTNMEESVHDQNRRFGLSASVGVIIPRPEQSVKDIKDELELTLADSKTASRLAPSEHIREQGRTTLIENTEQYDELRGFISLDGDGVPENERGMSGFISSCIRYVQATEQHTLEKLEIPEEHRAVLDRVHGDSKIPGVRILERIVFIKKRGEGKYVALAEDTPDEELQQYYLQKTESFGHELEALIDNALVLYQEKIDEAKNI